MAYGKILKEVLKKGKDFGSKYKDELLVGGAGIGGTAFLMDQLMYDPINPENHLRKFDAFGEELKEWENKPWDSDNDPEYVNKTMQRLHRELTNELDTMLVPRSAASEKATDYVLAFLQMAQKKEGAPTMTGIEDERVIYDNNPYTKNLPSGDTMNVGDFG
tara:strand:- start:1276 stop:1758 length:483 start_codon:yes stop_codon:yes gene_type:complete